MKRLKNANKGITLIALIVTIVILLILAGITIAILTGSNGLFARAKQAREETKKAQATDKINLKITNMQIASWAEKQEMPTLQYLADGFCQDEEMQYVELTTQKTASFLLPQIDASETESIFVKLKEYPYEFEINSKLQLASIDGVETEVADSNFAESEEYQQMISAINQLTQTNQQMQQKILELETRLSDTTTKAETSESEISSIKENYATKSYADALPQNVSKYTDLSWTLLKSSNSVTWSNLSINIDQYNYIALVLSEGTSITSPAIMSVEAFKSLCNSSDKALYAGYSDYYVAVYYSGSTVYGRTKDSKYFVRLYGIK